MIYMLSKTILTTSTCRFYTMDSENLINICKKLLPPLVETSHKGLCGRLGVFGGSVEFTGAPYFAGISAMRTGADLVYVFSASSAAPIIKSYSPELMVMPYLDSENAVKLISPWLTRLHAVLIGPGLGRSDNTFENIKGIIELIKTMPEEDGTYRPIVFDADGLFFISKNPDILKNYKGDIYITPNIVEFKNLLKSVFPNKNSQEELPEVSIEPLCKELGQNVTIVLKGRVDRIANAGLGTNCAERGSSRRCGGQGDLLSGILSVFAIWASDRRKKKLPHLCDVLTDNILAGYSACLLTRKSNRAAFQTYSRSMMSTDMIQVYPKIFNNTFGDSIQQ